MGFTRITLIQYGRNSSRVNNDDLAAGSCGQAVVLFLHGTRGIICTSIMSIVPSVRL